MNTVVSKLLLALALVAMSAGAVAQSASTYPSKPVRIIVGYGPGGANDLLMRMMASKLQQAWGQPVIVENKPGAASIISIEAVLKAPADGHTLTLNGTGGLIVNPNMFAKLPYDPVKSLVAIGPQIHMPLVLAVNPSIPVNTVAEFIDWAKKNDGNVNYAWASPAARIVTELFLQKAGLRATHIGYKGGSEVTLAVISGVVQWTLLDSLSITPQLKTGKIKPLAVSTAQRVSFMPHLPTMSEAGVPGFSTSIWLSMFAAAGTPRDILVKINEEVNRIFALPEVRDRLTEMGAEAVPSSAEAVEARIREEIEVYGNIVKSAGIKGQ